MEKIISLPFEFQEKEFYSLVRVYKNTDDGFELRITIMNGELQNKLEGNHILFIKDGKMQVDLPSKLLDVAKLKLQIAEAINKYFQMHALDDKEVRQAILIRSD